MNQTHSLTLEKGMTIDKEQTSDKNVILTNLNDSVDSFSYCINTWLNADVVYALLSLMILALLVYKSSVMAHQPLLRSWQLRFVWMNYVLYQKKHHCMPEQQLILDEFESSSNRFEQGLHLSWGLETSPLHILWSSTMIHDLSLFWQ